MHEPAHVIGCNPDCLPVLLKEGIQQTIPIAVQKGFGFEGALVPSAKHLAFA